MLKLSVEQIIQKIDSNELFCVVREGEFDLHEKNMYRLLKKTYLV